MSVERGHIPRRWNDNTSRTKLSSASPVIKTVENLNPPRAMIPRFTSREHVNILQTMPVERWQNAWSWSNLLHWRQISVDQEKRKNTSHLKLFTSLSENVSTNYSQWLHNYLTVEGPYISRSDTNIIIDSLCYNFIFQLTQFKSCTARGGRYVHTKTSQKVIHIIMSLYCPGWNHCPRCLMLRDTFSFSTTDWDVLEGWPRALSDNRLIWFESSKGLQGSRRTTQPLLPPISLPFDSRYFWAPEKKGMSNISNIHKQSGQWGCNKYRPQQK